jgi:hypothetical protein
MRRRLPTEPLDLIEQLTAWIAWRYASSDRSLVLTSAPTSLPPGLDRWIPGAVWRLAWQDDGAAVLYGMAPGNSRTRFLVARYDGLFARRQGAFERFPDGWAHVDGDDLKSRLNERERPQRAAA